MAPERSDAVADFPPGYSDLRPLAADDLGTTSTKRFGNEDKRRIGDGFKDGDTDRSRVLKQENDLTWIVSV